MPSEIIFSKTKCCGFSPRYLTHFRCRAILKLIYCRVSSTAYAACTGRKKRASSLIENAAPIADANNIKISRVDR